MIQFDADFSDGWKEHQIDRRYQWTDRIYTAGWVELGWVKLAMAYDRSIPLKHSYMLREQNVSGLEKGRVFELKVKSKIRVPHLFPLNHVLIWGYGVNTKSTTFLAMEPRRSDLFSLLGNLAADLMVSITRWFNLTKKISCVNIPKKQSHQQNHYSWVVVSNICYFHPYLGKWSNLTNIFQMGGSTTN